MKKYRDMDEASKDILKELGNIGTGNALTSLSQMMNLSFDLQVPILRIIKFQEAFRVLGQADLLQTGILVEVTGELKGMFLFLLDEEFTKTVLNTILGEADRDLTGLDDMEQSMICELGNIMCGSYIRALSQIMDLDLDVSVPELCIDMAGAILSVPFARFLSISEDILLIENMFHMSGETYCGRIFFLPELETLKKMFQKLKE